MRLMSTGGYRPFLLLLLGALGLAAAEPSRAAGHLTILHRFAGAPDGETPIGGLARTSTGVLIGTTYYGGAYAGPNVSEDGTVFALIPPQGTATAWTPTILANFKGYSDTNQCFSPVLGPNGIFGSRPAAPPVIDAAGNIYVAGSGACFGTIARLAPAGTAGTAWTVTSAVTFDAPNNQPALGNSPIDLGGLLITGTDTVYGTTESAGANQAGEIFATTLNTSPGISILYSFSSTAAAGNFPQTGLIAGPNGWFYGTTAGNGATGSQVIFRWNVNGTYQVLHTFVSATGIDPGPLVLRGNALFGTAANGGTIPGGGGSGQGVVYELNLSGATPVYSVLHVFGSGVDGAHPSSIVFSAAGNIYGNTTNGGPDGVSGMLYQLIAGQTVPWRETLLWYFNVYSTEGGEPSGSLVLDPAGNVYGTTQIGTGAATYGTVYELVP